MIIIRANRQEKLRSIFTSTCRLELSTELNLNGKQEWERGAIYVATSVSGRLLLDAVQQCAPVLSLSPVTGKSITGTLA